MNGERTGQSSTTMAVATVIFDFRNGGVISRHGRFREEKRKREHRVLGEYYEIGLQFSADDSIDAS